MKRLRAVMLIFALLFSILAGPLSGTAAASTLRFTFRFSPTGGWQLVASPLNSQPVFRTFARYRVRAGDTLQGLGSRFNTTVEELRRLNRLAGDRLLSGQLLLIPLTGTLRTTVLRPQAPAPPASPAPAPAAPQQAPAQETGAVLAPAEQQLLELVNRERAANGLPPLQADPELTRLARLKSHDMITLDYFDHQSPTYGSPFEMMRAAGVSYRLAGENLAGAGTVTAAHTALMNSPGHRANILNPGYTHIGIGAGVSRRFGLVFTQLFVGR